MRRWLVVVLLLSRPFRAEDWPQFRGPDGQGHSSERGLPLEWSETKNIVWKVPVAGTGWSSPVVADGKIWLTTSVRDRGTSLRLVAFDARDGRELVNTEVFHVNATTVLNPKNSFASPTPIIEGDRVYVHFGSDGTAAVTTAGAIVWKTRLTYQSQHGNGGSPALHGDLLIINCDGDDVAYVAALDKATGKTRWKKDRRSIAQSYVTPLVIRVGEKDQVISIGAEWAVAYDAGTGAEIWRVNYPGGFSNVPRPVYGHGLVYIATGFQQPLLLAVRPDGQGDVTRTHVAWRIARGVPYTPSPVIVGDELYLVGDIGVVTCVDAKTGTVHWQHRLQGNFSASPVFADGRIYFQSEDGVTAVIAPGKTFQPLAASTLDGSTLASMAVSDGSFYIRSDKNLYRIASR